MDGGTDGYGSRAVKMHIKTLNVTIPTFQWS